VQVNENPNGMNPDDFSEFLREFLSKQNGIDPEALAKAAGIPNDPKALEQMLKNFSAAMTANAEGGNGGVNWKLALDQAKSLAASGSKAIADVDRRSISDAVQIGTLWLDAVTTVGSLTTEPKLLTRELWVADSISLFQELSQPVAERMATALSQTMQQNLPEELDGMMAGAGAFMKAAGGAMFAMQLGQALGKLSQNVMSGSDVGLPIFQERAAFVPQNLSAFIAELELAPDQATIFLAIREMAFARLFKNSRWLRDSVVAQISTYASEISIDTDGLRELAEGADLNDPEQLRAALESGALIAKRTEEQERVLASIETLLALIEGWVEVVTEEATKLLPTAGAISEAVRRRRAAGGPAELTFGTLVGLELRPRRIREAAALWREVTSAVGVQKRDDLWNHPDLLPTSEEVDSPGLLLARINLFGSGDAMDEALKKWLGE
jgi:putative hydrolase